MATFSFSEFLEFLVQLKIISWSMKKRDSFSPLIISVKKKKGPKYKNETGTAISINYYFPFSHQKTHKYFK